MPKKVIVSLHGIVDRIDATIKKLAQGQSKALTQAEKKSLAVKIKSLKKIRKEVTNNCPKSKPSYGIIILEK